MRRLFLLCGMLLASCTLWAADDLEQTPSRFGQGVLWKVSVAGKPPSFLFGTLHLNADSVLALPPAAEDAFAASTVFVGEVVLDGAAHDALRLAMISTRPDLPHRLGADWPGAEALLAVRGIPAGLREHLHPWAALLVLLKPGQRSDKDGLDVMLQRRARRAGKRVVGLERIEEQIAALGTLPEDTQIALLREAVSSAGRLEEDTASFIRFYLAGDLSGAWAFHLQNRSPVPGVRARQDALADALITRRNQLFAERLVPLISEGGSFVAVGALHLPGAGGIPALLSARGFRVERAD